MKNKKLTSVLLSPALAIGLTAGSLPVMFTGGCSDDPKTTAEQDLLLGDIGGVKVWQSAGVPDDKAAYIYTNILWASYSGAGSYNKTQFENNLTDIYIRKGDAVQLNGKVWNIGYDAELLDIASIFSSIMSQIQQKSDIMLAHNNMKNQVLSQIKKIQAEKVKA
jgi:hypothetical protein